MVELLAVRIDVPQALGSFLNAHFAPDENPPFETIGSFRGFCRRVKLVLFRSQK